MAWLSVVLGLARKEANDIVIGSELSPVCVPDTHANDETKYPKRESEYETSDKA